MCVSTQGHPEIVKMLLESGADVNVQDGDGLMALAAASKKGNAEVVQLLKDSGAS